MLFNGGYRLPLWRSSSVTWSATACAEMRNKSSVIWWTPVAITPKAIPGKMYALLPCPGLYVLPLYVTSPNGEPDENIHLPWNTEARLGSTKSNLIRRKSERITIYILVYVLLFLEKEKKRERITFVHRSGRTPAAPCIRLYWLDYLERRSTASRYFLPSLLEPRSWTPPPPPKRLREHFHSAPGSSFHAVSCLPISTVGLISLTTSSRVFITL